MARLWAFAALSGMAWAVTASAGDVYVCKGPKGVNTYQNIPCAHPSDELRHQTYSQSLATAPAQPQAPVHYNYQPVPVARRASAPSAYTPPAPEPAAGFECVAGSRRWVQAHPCPSTYLTSAPVDVDGVDDFGIAVHGTGSISLRAPVKQTELDRETLCRKVQDGANMGHGWSPGRQSYERNKLRGQLGC